jgi:crotonobetainyl-CoA:carnitine CoA-transferase CaiB-like acyl-CoA transferase
MPFPHASQALSRFTVLDLTRVRSGPTCVRQLADWGANVIKVDALIANSPSAFRQSAWLKRFGFAG